MSNYHHNHRKLLRNYTPVIFNPNGYCINGEDSFHKHFLVNSNYNNNNNNNTKNPFILNDTATSPVKDVTFPKRYSLRASKPPRHPHQTPLIRVETPKVLVFERPSRWLKTSSCSPNHYMYNRCHFLEEEQKKTSVTANRLLNNHDNKQLCDDKDAKMDLRENTIELKKETEKCFMESQIATDLRHVKSRKNLFLTSYYGIAPLRKITYADLLNVLDPLVYR